MITKNLAIKLNNTVADCKCAFCSDTIEPELGPCLFVADGWRMVCATCGRKYSPILATMLDTFWQTVNLTRTEKQLANPLMRIVVKRSEESQNARMNIKCEVE